MILYELDLLINWYSMYKLQFTILCIYLHCYTYMVIPSSETNEYGLWEAITSHFFFSILRGGWTSARYECEKQLLNNRSILKL